MIDITISLSIAASLASAFSSRYFLSLFLFYLRLDHEPDWIRLGRLKELGWTPLQFDVVLHLAYRSAMGKEQFSDRVSRSARRAVLSILSMIFLGGFLPCALYVARLLYG